MGFTQYSCLAQPELYICLYDLAMKTESQPESFPVHVFVEGRRLAF